MASKIQLLEVMSEMNDIIFGLTLNAWPMGLEERKKAEQLHQKIKELLRSSSMEQKYVFVKDDDCHWYMIKAEDKDKFNKMLDEANAKDDHDAFCEAFEEYRLGGGISHISFENPVDIKTGESLK